MLHEFWANRTSSKNEPVEKSLLASTTVISLQIEYTTDVEMKCI